MSVYAKLWRRMAPPWFTGPHISTFYEAVGNVLDCEAQRAMDGRLASIVYAGAEPFAAKLSTGQRIECQPDALPQHFLDRSLTPYPSESILSQRLRLSRWHQLHADRGTLWGAIDHVRPYFADRVAAGFAYPQITIGFQTNEATPAAVWYRVSPTGVRTIRRVSPSNLNYNGQPAKRTRWWAFLEMTGTGYTPPPVWGGFSWGDGTMWGSAGALPFTAQRQADVAAMFDWKGAHSWKDGVVLIWPGYTALDIGGTPTQDANGRWSLPNGPNTWGVLADPGTGKPTRPAGWQWIYDGGGG